MNCITFPSVKGSTLLILLMWFWIQIPTQLSCRLAMIACFSCITFTQLRQQEKFSFQSVKLFPRVICLYDIRGIFLVIGLNISPLIFIQWHYSFDFTADLSPNFMSEGKIGSVCYHCS